jgi:monoamine oxidase
MNENDYTDLIKQILSQRGYGKSANNIWIDEARDMAYSYSRGYYEDTNSKEVANAVLEAYADGVPFETLIKKNKAVRQYWYSIQSERAARLKRAEQEKIRLAKLAEKQAAEKAQREEVMSKLSREELEAFGLVKKGKR